ncbi:MAG: efflux RND transporter permease subunit [Deltaproteobacteria bacterium]|nr:efflux RND transporter permease subunit [Deltaproteobacteria bacterium]
MILSDFSISRPVFAWILMFGLIFFGALSFRKMGVNENPDVEFPTITVSYTYVGATPEVIEKDVVEPVEGVLVAMQGIRNISSTSDRGSARISLEFELDKDIDFALQEVNTLLSRAQRVLPNSVEAPVATKLNINDRPIMYLALSSQSLPLRELMLLFRDRIRDRLSTIDGVADVQAFGYHEPVLRIDIDAKKLTSLQLTASDVVNSIQREHSELPAGKFEYDSSEELIRVMGEASKISDFETMVIGRRGGAPNFKTTRLRDVAKITEGLENIRRISRVNGVLSLGVAVQKQRGVNAVTTADRVKERLAEINKTLPPDTSLMVNLDTTKFIRESIGELLFTLLLSAILTSLICWLFIGSWSSAVNILLAIPTSVIGTFIFIHQFGFTLNTFSLLALALSIGIIVDDAIVMLENITRYMQKGFDRVNASFKGAREVTFVVIATTVALVAIFIPIAFMEGIEGRFFFEFVVTIAIAVSLSSVEALTLAPMRCSQFLNITERSSFVGKALDRTINRTRTLYGILLNWCLDHRWTVVCGSVLLFAASLLSFRILPTELIPQQDQGSLFLTFQAPAGSSLSYTEAKVAEFEKIALAHPGVERVFTAIGGFGEGGQSNRGNGFIMLKERDQRTQDQFDIASDLRKAVLNIEGLRVFVRDSTGGQLAGRRGSPIEFTLNGPDPQEQRRLYLEFKKRMDTDTDIVDTRSDDVETLPEVHIIPDRERAAQRGVEILEIAQTINTMFGGSRVSQYTSGGRRFDIVAQLGEKDRDEMADVEPILIRNNRGELLPLKELVRFEKRDGPQIIFREDRQRGLRVDASVAKGVKVGEITSRVEGWAKEILPPHYFIKFSTTPQERLWETVLIMLLGLIVSYMILSSQFNSFIDPLLVFLAIPFGLTGSIFALLLGGQSLNLYSMIGILLTMGIVKKNSILLVEFANQLRDRGRDIRSALSEASSIRLRPILMTNFATIAAAIPPALALGPGAETRIPMALTVIGGVTLSVLFTLFVVPCTYSLVAPKRIKVLEEH